ncbi:sensor histidine kinase [Janthinobacterium agaricidamnosum]|uniref:Sensory box protein n=1 Tax=Janthinobacterium agaricidamnosum NBRC 102515 = DSM 9628 TaxID=1349767 RepID=W0V8J2_9BURK|nr:PAS domain S-box protein [Janthinobacterium agaricidamnosum]CDG83915.1 sensory box protein [Janthinobacterium agaricidamnosum NBRC 102515 = DSM 9628]
MNDAFDPALNTARLREQAEVLLSERAIMAGKSNQDVLKQWHELQVSQIELEMQGAALAELQQINEEFENGWAMYAQLYELAPMAYFSIDRAGRISRANVAAATLLKRVQQQLLDLSFEQFIAPQGQARFRQFIDTVYHSGVRQVLETSLFDGADSVPNGAVRIEANVDPDGGSVRMIVTDLGDQDVRESALRQAFVILDSIKEGVLVTDAANRIISVNPAFTSITGYLAEEAIGRDPSFLGGASDMAPLYHDMWTGLTRDGSWQGELVNRRKSGERYVEWLSITQMRTPEGGVANFVGVFSDITERKLAETSLRELHHELDVRVIERTAELLQANQLLQQEIAERERAEVALRQAERFFHSTIDSLSDRVLVLDDSGAVVYANQACYAFAGHVGTEIHYLRHCETDPRWQHGAGHDLAAGIRSVCRGALDTFTVEYEFLTHTGPRWSQAKVSRFSEAGVLRVVVSHTDITERKSMESALLKSHAQLRQLALHLETAKEDERQRISRDIHDELGQNLLALRIDISMLGARTEQSHPRLHRRVAAVLDNVDTTIKSVRGIMNELRPMALDLGLQAAIEWQIQDFNKRSGIACRLKVRDEAIFGAVGSATAIVLFRIVQEALSNVTRHARASSAEIELSLDADGLSLLISDDGIGITPEQRGKKQCFGLIGIAERVSALGGEFIVGPGRAPALGAGGHGEGCCLSMRIPLPEAGAA